MSRQSGAAGAALDALLIEAFQSYREGLRRQPPPPAPLPPRDFDVLCFLGTIGWMPPGHRLRLRNLGIACSAGLAAARKGQLDEALGHYEQARESLDSLGGAGRQAWLLGTSTYQPGAAYVDFRRGAAERARDRLDLAMDAALELEQLGLPVMQMHRIQQGHNLARMDLRLGRRETATKLAGMLLAYLEGRIDELPYHRDWRAWSLRAVQRSLVRAMIHQVIGETAGRIVAGDAPEEEWRGLIEASRISRDPETAVVPQVQYALRAQGGRLAGDPEGYLRNLERFFRGGIRHCHPLWYAVMVELVEFCGELDTRPARQVRDVILHDSAKWKGLPTFLGNRLGGPTALRTVA